jgi:mannose-1-phosphate guanylyltransferase
MSDSKRNGLSDSAVRAGIILAGGDGKRLRELVYRRRGDYLPKQYLNLVGSRSMLEHTFSRAEKLITAQNLLVVITREHLQFDEVRRQLASHPRENVVVQPENKDTAPGLLLPLMHLYRRRPEATVAVFPSNHFILEENIFMRSVEQAFHIAERDASRIVLLGMEPRKADPEYGYVIPGEPIEVDGSVGGRSVEMFVEKPATEAAQKIIRTGALWNTLVFVARCNTLLRAIERAAPRLYRAFASAENAIGTVEEQRSDRARCSRRPATDHG